ncbi:hypothetical protein D770_11920 [Flammeovirgaceae bacterium 311]|nr:hypothetical protein D770_11920 [Flammeovirgaceae bacterium 311]
MDAPLVEKEYLLEKFPGKGGWTYAAIPEIPQDKKAHFGWVKVRGTIDGLEIKSCHLMPMGDSRLFLPVKAEIRKKIGKKEGDWVKVVLYADNAPLEVPQELLLCLQDEPQARQNFMRFTEGEQKAYIDWIYSAKTEDTRVARIAKAIDAILNNLKFTDRA